MLIVRLERSLIRLVKGRVKWELGTTSVEITGYEQTKYDQESDPVTRKMMI